MNIFKLRNSLLTKNPAHFAAVTFLILDTSDFLFFHQILFLEIVQFFQIPKSLDHHRTPPTKNFQLIEFLFFFSVLFNKIAVFNSATMSQLIHTVMKLQNKYTKMKCSMNITLNIHVNVKRDIILPIKKYLISMTITFFSKKVDHKN